MTKISKYFIILGTILIIISITLLIRNNYQEYLSGKKSNEALTIIKDNLDNSKEIINSQINIQKDKLEMETTSIKGIDYIGTLTIPTINLELPIISEYNSYNLNIAPTRYYGSLYTNDLIICGHSYKTHFKQLINLKQKDIVIFTDINGTNYKYEVLEIEILNQEDVDKMINNEFDLTLYTCTTDGLRRVTIRCNRITETI